MRLAGNGNEDTPSGGAYAWYVCLVLALATLVSVLDRFLMSVLLESIKADFSLTDTEVGLLAGLGFTLLYCTLGVPFGRLADRMNRRTMIAIAIAWWTAATAACGFAQSYEALLVARLSVGIGEAALMPAAMSLIASYFSKNQLGRATAAFNIGGGVGNAIAFIAGGYLLAWFIVQGGWTISGHHFAPWQITILLAAIPGIPVALLVLTIREPARRSPHRRPPSLAAVWAYISLHKSAFISFTISWACIFGIVHTLLTWSPTFYVRNFQLNISQAAAIVGTIGLICNPIGNLLGGAATDWLERRGTQGAPAIIIALSLALALPTALLIILSHNLVISVVGFALYTVVALAGGPPGFSASQRMAPPQMRGLLVALAFSIASICSLGIGPLVVGMLSDSLFATSPNGLGYSMLGAIALFSILGSIAALISRRHMHHVMEEALKVESL